MEMVENVPGVDFGDVPLEGDFRARLRAALDPEDLMPMLTSEDNRVRQEALMLLGDRRPPEDPDADAPTSP